MGGRLAQACAEVTLVDRGAHLEALRTSGLTIVHPDGGRETIERVRVTDDTAQAGEQDVVVLGVKTYDLEEAAAEVPPLLGPETVVLPVQNGIPWWYFHGFGPPLEGRRLQSLDPRGTLEARVDPERVLGCVPYVASERVEPGVVRHREGGYFPVGEPDGSTTGRVRAVADLLEKGGLRSRVLDDVRSEIWLKALGSLSLNPVSALTGATLEEICRDPDTRALVRGMMEEARDVAEALGASLRRSVERRIEGAEAVGDHRTSMLQDLKAGRELELAGLVGSVLELAELTGTPAPRIEAVFAATKLLAETRGRDPAGPGPAGGEDAPDGSGDGATSGLSG